MQKNSDIGNNRKKESKKLEIIFWIVLNVAPTLLLIPFFYAMATYPIIDYAPYYEFLLGYLAFMCVMNLLYYLFAWKYPPSGDPYGGIGDPW